MLLKMFLLSLVMIAGFSGVLVGSILMATGLHLVPGLIAAIVGLPVGVLSLRAVVRLNREYQEQHLQAVLRDPAEIVARWQLGAVEVILARRGLFLGRDFLPFGAAYQTLTHMRLDGHTLHLEFRNIGVEAALTREVEVAPEAVPAIREYLAARGPR